MIYLRKIVAAAVAFWIGLFSSTAIGQASSADSTAIIGIIFDGQTLGGLEIPNYSASIEEFISAGREAQIEQPYRPLLLNPSVTEIEDAVFELAELEPRPDRLIVYIHGIAVTTKSDSTTRLLTQGYLLSAGQTPRAFERRLKRGSITPEQILIDARDVGIDSVYIIFAACRKLPSEILNDPATAGYFSTESCSSELPPDIQALAPASSASENLIAAIAAPVRNPNSGEGVATVSVEPIVRLEQTAQIGSKESTEHASPQDSLEDDVVALALPSVKENRAAPELLEWSRLEQAPSCEGYKAYGIAFPKAANTHMRLGSKLKEFCVPEELSGGEQLVHAEPPRGQESVPPQALAVDESNRIPEIELWQSFVKEPSCEKIRDYKSRFPSHPNTLLRVPGLLEEYCEAVPSEKPNLAQSELSEEPSEYTLEAPDPVVLRESELAMLRGNPPCETEDEIAARRIPFNPELEQMLKEAVQGCRSAPETEEIRLPNIVSIPEPDPVLVLWRDVSRSGDCDRISEFIETQSDSLYRSTAQRTFDLLCIDRRDEFVLDVPIERLMAQNPVVSVPRERRIGLVLQARAYQASSIDLAAEAGLSREFLEFQRTVSLGPDALVVIRAASKVAIDEALEAFVSSAPKGAEIVLYLDGQMAANEDGRGLFFVPEDFSFNAENRFALNNTQFRKAVVDVQRIVEALSVLSPTRVLVAVSDCTPLRKPLSASELDLWTYVSSDIGCGEIALSESAILLAGPTPPDDGTSRDAVLRQFSRIVREQPSLSMRVIRDNLQLIMPVSITNAKDRNSLYLYVGPQGGGHLDYCWFPETREGTSYCTDATRRLIPTAIPASVTAGRRAWDLTEALELNTCAGYDTFLASHNRGSDFEQVESAKDLACLLERASASTELCDVSDSSLPMTREGMRVFQRRLLDLQCWPGGIDGRWGGNTSRGLRQFITEGLNTTALPGFIEGQRPGCETLFALQDHAESKGTCTLRCPDGLRPSGGTCVTVTLANTRSTSSTISSVPVNSGVSGNTDASSGGSSNSDDATLSASTDTVLPTANTSATSLVAPSVSGVSSVSQTSNTGGGRSSTSSDREAAVTSNSQSSETESCVGFKCTSPNSPIAF